MPDPKIGKTGNAPIIKQGQTTDEKYGSNPDYQNKVRGKARDLTPKGR